MRTVKLRGVEYPIAFNLAAFEALEVAFGSFEAALEATGTAAAIKIFEALAGGAREELTAAGMPCPELPSAAEYRLCRVGEIRAMKKGCVECISDDMQATVEADPPEVPEKKAEPLRED